MLPLQIFSQDVSGPFQLPPVVQTLPTYLRQTWCECFLSHVETLAQISSSSIHGNKLIHCCDFTNQGWSLTLGLFNICCSCSRKCTYLAFLKMLALLPTTIARVLDVTPDLAINQPINTSTNVVDIFIPDFKGYSRQTELSDGFPERPPSEIPSHFWFCKCTSRPMAFLGVLVSLNKAWSSKHSYCRSHSAQCDVVRCPYYSLWMETSFYYSSVTDHIQIDSFQQNSPSRHTNNT